MPSGGDGFYYFAAYFTVIWYEYGVFDIQINEETLFTAWGETETSTFADRVHTSCSAAAIAVEGNTTLSKGGLNFKCSGSITFQMF